MLNSKNLKFDEITDSTLDKSTSVKMETKIRPTPIDLLKLADNVYVYQDSLF